VSPVLFAVLASVPTGCLSGGADFSGDGDVDADTDADTDVDADGDCAAEGPFDMQKLDAIASEDVAFDADGNVIGSDTASLLESPYSGSPVVLTSAIQQQAGLRFLPDGRLVVADDSEGNLYLVEPDGTSTVLLSGLAYPNGIAIDLDGFVYLTEKSAGRVRRIDPDTGDFTILEEGQIAEPNGITFDPAYRFLYVAGTSGEGIIYRMPIHEDGTAGDLEEWAQGVGFGRLDGMACDSCGNVYVCDYSTPADGNTVIHRISPDGRSQEIVFDTSTLGGVYYGAFLSNMDWGTGVGGWRTDSLYFAETLGQRVIEVRIGVESKPRAYP
jgi:sugar lactone lactonase YvrE